MDFTRVKKLEIPEGEVKKIEIGGVKVWERPASGYTISGTFLGGSPTVYMILNGVTYVDNDMIGVPIPPNTEVTFGIINGHSIDGNFKIVTENGTEIGQGHSNDGYDAHFNIVVTGNIVLTTNNLRDIVLPATGTTNGNDNAGMVMYKPDNMWSIEGKVKGVPSGYRAEYYIIHNGTTHVIEWGPAYYDEHYFRLLIPKGDSITFSCNTYTSGTYAIFALYQLNGTQIFRIVGEDYDIATETITPTGDIIFTETGTGEQPTLPPTGTVDFGQSRKDVLSMVMKS